MTGVSEEYPIPADAELPALGKTVWNLMVDQAGLLWVGMNAGLAVISPEESKVVAVQRPPFTDDLEAAYADQVFRIVEQSDGTKWLGTGYGLWRCTLRGGELDFHYVHPKGPLGNSLSGPFIQDIWVDQKDDLWVGTWANGLNKLVYNSACEDTHKITAFRSEDFPDLGLDIDKMMAVLEDRSGVLWAATGSNLFKYAPSVQKIKAMSMAEGAGYAGENQIVKSILRDRQGNLWVGTRKGLNLLPAATTGNAAPQWQQFVADKADPTALRHDNIYGLYEDRNGVIWISTYGGLHFVLPQAAGLPPVFRRLTTKDGLPANYIYGITEDEDGWYWMATYAKLARMQFDPLSDSSPREIEIFDSSKEEETALVNATCYIIEKDRFGQLWVGTYDGLSKIIREGLSVRFENYRNIIGDSTSLTHNTIPDLHLDAGGRFWVGTRMGLHLVVQNSAIDSVHFRHFGISDGFRNEVIQFIDEDARGNLWIGTNDGLVQFDPEAALRGGKGVIAVFDKDDGMPSSSTVFRASHVDERGQVFIGTGGGLATFWPGRFPENDVAPSIVLTDLKLQNQTVKPTTDKNATLSSSITHSEELKLRYRQNMVEFQFAALDFHRPEKNRYAYRLVGFDDQWIDSGERNSATYTNLAPGDYTFEVKGTNNDGKWTTTPLSLKLKVLPPPWRTWWACVLYGLLIGGVIYTLFRWRLYNRTREIQQQARLEATRLEERELLRRKNAADFHDELGHRLTKISLLLELADRHAAEPSNGIKGYLEKIRQHSTSLSEGVRDLIWGLDPEKDNLYQTLLRLQEFGDRLFEYSPIRFRTEGIDPRLADIDLPLEVKKQVLFMFKEAMNNTLKHAEAQIATLSFHRIEEKFFFTFWDDGIGIKREEENGRVGYGLGNMAMRARKIGGELSISGAPGTGTMVRLSLPLAYLENVPAGKLV